MDLEKILKRAKYISIAIIVLVIVGFFSLEFIQKKTFDIKADAIGTNRTITFYSFTGQPIQTYSDKSMRFDSLPTGGISVWLGSQNKKVHSNMDYIVEDK
jgi:hypothetical protein